MVREMQTHIKLEQIKLLVVDVDGVLTDGTIAISQDAREIKFFNSLDGHGIRLWKRAGMMVAFLSGRGCDAVGHRGKELDVDFVLQNCHDKLPALKKLLQQLNLSARQVAYIGDDLPDLPVIEFVGFSAAVANAVDEVKKHADYVTSRQGGKGAVREVVEYILKNTNKWHKIMKRYLPEH